MTVIINVVSTPGSDEQSAQEEAPAPEAPKPKAAKPTRAPKKQLAVVEPEVEVTTSLDEVEAVVRMPSADELKVDVKVACPDCGKPMSAKTLRYSHGPNCAAKKQKESQREPPQQSPIEEVIETEVQKRLNNTRAVRAARRQEMVQNLIRNAF